MIRMRDLAYIIGICLAAVMGMALGKAEGIKVGINSVVQPEVNIEKQCIAWFFDADLRAAKRHMCGGKK